MNITKFPTPDRQTSSLGRHKWSVPRLFELSKDLPIMDVPLNHLNIRYTYDGMSLRELAEHVMAVNEADLSFPIILDEDGEIMDGRHRVIKALIKGRTTISAVRFEVNPSPCEISEDIEER